MQYLTPRGWFVFGVVSALVVWGLVLVSACLWWVGIDSPESDHHKKGRKLNGKESKSSMR
jgi:hypothetical protein